MSEIDQLRARILELEGEVARLSSPEWFYDAQDPENTCSDLQHIAHTLTGSEVLRMAGARTVWKGWAALRVVTVDEAGFPSKTEVATFATQAEAAASWGTSLETARAAGRPEAGS